MKGNEKVENKIKFKDNPGLAKIIYGAIIAILCISAIIVGLVAANNRKKPSGNVETPGVGDNGNVEEKPGTDDSKEPEKPDDEKKPQGNNEKLTFISPVVGTVVKVHDLSVPVFSETLEEWRVHAGIDISCEDGADVFAAAGGVVSEVYSHPLLGYTVVVKHNDTLFSIYSNLDANSGVNLAVGDEISAGAKIGKVGDSSISELAEEPHLHFEVMLAEASVNPLDYISEEAKRVSLGIEVNEAA